MFCVAVCANLAGPGRQRGELGTHCLISFSSFSHCQSCNPFCFAPHSGSTSGNQFNHKLIQYVTNLLFNHWLGQNVRKCFPASLLSCCCGSWRHELVSCTRSRVSRLGNIVLTCTVISKASGHDCKWLFCAVVYVIALNWACHEGSLQQAFYESV